jgi:type II secretory pathway component PulF
VSALSFEERSIVAQSVAALRARGWSTGRCVKLVAERLPAGLGRQELTSLAADLEAGRKPSRHKDPFFSLLSRGESVSAQALRDSILAIDLERQARGTWAMVVGLPAGAICLAFAFLTFASWFIGPSFDDLFKSYGSSLPAPTQLVLDSQPFLRWLGPVLMAATAGAALLVPRAWTPELTALRRATLLRQFAAMVSAGTNEADALSQVGSRARTLAEALAPDTYDVALTAVLRDAGPAEIARAIATETETSFRQSLDQLRAIGPTLGMIASLFAAAVVSSWFYALYLPIFSLAGAIK